MNKSKEVIFILLINLSRITLVCKQNKEEYDGPILDTDLSYS